MVRIGFDQRRVCGQERDTAVPDPEDEPDHSDEKDRKNQRARWPKSEAADQTMDVTNANLSEVDKLVIRDGEVAELVIVGR